MKKHENEQHCKENKKHECHCEETCECEKDCDCGCNEESCDCGCNCGCECDCKCDCECDCDCNCKKSQEAAKYLELAQRVQAEFENYKRRTQTIERDAKERGIVLAVEKLLPVIDSVDNAKKQIKDENIIKALDLINNQIMQSLHGLGVERIEAVGKEFNPNLHNAIMTGSEEGKKEDEIIEEFQAGFKLNEKVIRHSVVKVNK